MPRFYGKPTAKAAQILATREDLNTAVRSNDQKLLLGLGGYDDETDTNVGGMGYIGIVPGIQTNRFTGYADYLQAATTKVWASSRAVDIIANCVLSTEMKMAWRDPAKNKKKTPVRVDPELGRILLNPNPYDTISEMLYLLVCHLKFTGNAFWYKDQMNAYGQPKNVYWLNPRFMIIVPDKQLRVAKYIYRVNGREIAFDPEEIIHFRRPHANDPLWGLGEVEQGETLFDDFINRSLYNVRYMANGAFPSSLLVQEDFDGLQEDWDKKKARFNEVNAGARNAGKVAWMNGKWSLLQMGVNSRDMQDLEKHSINVEQIYLNHGVPLSVAGFSNRINYATARQDDINFRRYTILPVLNMICDALNSDRGFIAAFNKDTKLDFSLSGLIDVEQAMKDYGPLFDRGGLSNDELRELCGLQPTGEPLMSQRYVLNTYVPLELAGVIMDTTSGDGSTPPSGKPKPGKPKPGSADDGAPEGGDNANTA